MPQKKVSVTKVYTLDTFMKQSTNLKIASSVLEDLIYELDALVVKITNKSAAIAQDEGRKTIMSPDLEKALEEILQRGPLTVDELIEKIEPLSIIELKDLSQRIQKKADELLRRQTLGFKLRIKTRT